MNSFPDEHQSASAQTSLVAQPAVGRNPALFVVGCPRSGTTLLQRMLDHHPQMAVANDTHFIPRALERTRPDTINELIQGRDLRLDEQLVAGVRDYHRFTRLGLSEQEVNKALEGADTYQQLISRLYDGFGKQQGKPVAGEKTPDYVRHLPLLHGMFPEARSIHIIRDGRDVGLSLLEWAGEKKGPGRFSLWNEQPVAVGALWWQWQVQAGREAAEILGPGTHLQVHYEDLVDRPQEVLCRITDFLRLPFHSAMLSYHEGRARPNSGLSAKQAWLPPTSGLRCWKTDMRERDVILFELLAGELLNDLGYPLTGLPASSEIRSTAREARAWWEETMSAKLEDARKKLAAFAAAHSSGQPG